MFIVRPAKIKDLPEVVKMRLELCKYHKAFGSDFKIDKTAQKYYYKLYKGYIYSIKKKLLVAECGKKLIGFVSAHIPESEPISKYKISGHIRDMYVDEKFRRRGVAGEILKVLYRWFKSKNVKCVYLNVVCANQLGRNAWTKYGFEDYAIRKRKILK